MSDWPEATQIIRGRAGGRTGLATEPRLSRWEAFMAQTAMHPSSALLSSWHPSSPIPLQMLFQSCLFFGGFFFFCNFWVFNKTMWGESGSVLKQCVRWSSCVTNPKGAWLTITVNSGTGLGEGQRLKWRLDSQRNSLIPHCLLTLVLSTLCEWSHLT